MLGLHPEPCNGCPQVGRHLWALVFGIFWVGIGRVCFLGIQVPFSSPGIPGILDQLWGFSGRIVFLFEAFVLDMRYMLSFRGQVRVVGCNCDSTIFTLIRRLFLLLVVLSFFRICTF